MLISICCNGGVAAFLYCELCLLTWGILEANFDPMSEKWLLINLHMFVPVNLRLNQTLKVYTSKSNAIAVGNEVKFTHFENCLH